MKAPIEDYGKLPTRVVKYIKYLQKQLQKKQQVVDDNKHNGYIGIMLVPYGYQIDVLSVPDYMNGEVKVLHSECRDWGEDLDVGIFESEIIDMVRKGKD